MMTAIPSAPVDADTASLLALVHADPIHERDVEVVVQAITDTARDNKGVVDPNLLRLRLRNEHGCIVHPPVIGATISALRHKGALRPLGWVITEGSHSRNNGKPARSYTCHFPT